MEDCLFCRIWKNKERKIITENECWFAVHPDKRFQRTEGHVLILPKQHIEDMEEIKFKEWVKLIAIFREIRQFIKEKYKTEDYNFGLNHGKFAGQTEPHLHYHYFPRRQGDVPDPRGGIGNILPQGDLKEGAPINNEPVRRCCQ